MTRFRTFSAASACAAALSMSAVPAVAVELPRVAPSSGPVAPPEAAPAADKANGHRWYPYRGRHHHHDRIDAGDVLAGVLILGTVAAIASSANKNRERYRYPERREPRPQDRQRYRSGYEGDGRGLDNAVGMCVDEIERGNDRVGSVDGANRTGEGWVVSGALEGGAGFTCRIDNDGRIRNVDIGGARAGYAPAEDNQYGDDVYARARLAQAGSYSEPGIAPADAVDDRPVWNPSAQATPADDGDDGRYAVSQAPDFEQGDYASRE